MAAHAKAILKIVVGKDEVREIGELPEGKYKWGGAIAGANGDVYCFPSDTERVLKVIPTPSHVLGRISPIFPRFFPFFARFHRLAEAVPTSPKPEPRAKKQPTRPRGGSSIQALSAYGTNHLKQRLRRDLDR